MEYTTYQKSEILTEKQKEEEDYLIGCIDSAIAELVYEKDELKKAYNYYNGERDKDQFRHLEENFNIGTPTSIEFIPLVRRHIDVLIGEHLQNKLKPKITCKDKKTLNNIFKDKQKAIYDAEMERLKSQLYSNIDYALKPAAEKNASQPPIDNATDAELTRLQEDIEKHFISEYELAAQHVLTHFIQSKNVDLYHKLKTLFLDLLIAGECFYEVKLQHEGEVPDIVVYSPFDTFVEKNINSPYVNRATRRVVRERMNKQQIISELGHLMTKAELEELDTIDGFDESHNVYYVRSSDGGMVVGGEGGVTMLPGTNHYDEGYYGSNLIPVYRVEWISNNQVGEGDDKRYRMDRYEGIRIGSSIYLNMGKSDNVVRSIEHPYRCSLSLNGISHSVKGSRPYSLVLATANLQDKYDILHFHRDNMIANSGVQGDWLDVSLLPEFLGTSAAERIMKWKAYKKGGLALINTAQEGRNTPINTTFGGFDDTVSGQAIQAIQLAITQTEEICSSITGVFRERIGGIEQRDAVTNVEVGIKQSAVITKQYFQLMDSITTELLMDALNMAKISYRKGMVGSIILGNKLQKIFTVDGKKFSFTDHDIHIADSGDIIRDMQKIDMITMELIKTGQVDVDTVLEGVGTESLTEMKDSLLGSFKKKKEENNQLQQATQQLQQTQEQLAQAQKELQKVSGQIDQYKQAELAVKQKKLEIDYELGKEANQDSREFDQGKLRIDEKRVDLEQLQLVDGNPNNDEIKNH